MFEWETLKESLRSWGPGKRSMGQKLRFVHIYSSKHFTKLGSCSSKHIVIVWVTVLVPSVPAIIQLIFLLGVITTAFSRCGLFRGEHAQGQPPYGPAVAGRQCRPPMCLHPADQLLRSDAPPPVDPLCLSAGGSRSVAAAGRAVC